MNIRKDRAHLYGATNLDFRSAEPLPVLKQSQSPNLTHLDLLSIPKKNFDEILKSKYLKNLKPTTNPFTETYSFYKDKGKPALELIKISNTREKQLEKTGHIPFTGESNIIYNEKVLSKNYKKLIEEKKEQNANTTQETQLIGNGGLGSLNHDTLEGKVDVQKIKEIRRIIRRKYGARGNFQKIFNQWDNENTGAVSVHNLFDMIKKFGININLDEARVLVASADHDRSNDLNLDEFLELIFTDNEALNVDLKKIPVLSEKEKSTFNDRMRNELNEAKIKRHHEQMNYILKNKLNQIARVFLDTDYNKTGEIDYTNFHHHLRQLGFSEKLLPDSDINFIYEQYKTKVDGFNYPNFLRNLKDFEFKSTDLRFEKLQTFIQQPKEVQGMSEVQKRLKMYDISEPEEYLVLDNQSINVSKLENQRYRAKKIFREIYKKFPNIEKFQSHLKEFADNLNDNVVDNEEIFSKEQLKNFIKDFFEKNPANKIEKRDIEGFLTNFTFNKHDETKISLIPDLIYNEEDKDYYKRLGYKNYGPLPSKSKRYCKEYPIKTVEDENFKFSDFDESTSDLMKVKHHHRTTENKKLDAILQQVENKFFLSSTNTALKVFRLFDLDNDGFVSQDNFIKKLKEINLLKDEEIPILLNYLDPTQKGILNFHEFASKIRPLALKTDEMGRQTIIPNITPDKEHTMYLQSSLPFIKTAIFDSKFSMTPHSEDYISGATRFGSSPLPVNTFLNFQANTTESPMFVTPKARFEKGLSASLEFQKSEKTNKLNRHNAKLETIRSFDHSIRNRIDDDFTKKMKASNNQLKMKGLAQWSYEHRNHLKNDWN